LLFPLPLGGPNTTAVFILGRFSKILTLDQHFTISELLSHHTHTHTHHHHHHHHHQRAEEAEHREGKGPDPEHKKELLFGPDSL
jgi:hypothetical protein